MIMDYWLSEDGTAGSRGRAGLIADARIRPRP